MRSYGTCPKCKTGLLRPSGAGGCNCTCELCGYWTRQSEPTRYYGSGRKKSGCGTWVIVIIILWFLLQHF